ncbi:MAG: hypothetical protein AAGK32_00925, partial [Actinomycetota bacterium]
TAQLQSERADRAEAEGWTEEHLFWRAPSLTAAQYGRSAHEAERLGARHGVEVAHFWQPILPNLGRDGPMVPTVAHHLEFDLDSIPEVVALYEWARVMSGVDSIDLTGSLDGSEQPTFFDYCHTNEVGARLQAEAMWPHVDRLLPEP